MHPIQVIYAALVLMAALCLTFVGSAAAAAEDTVVLRFAVLGDAEPKPDPMFPNVQGAVGHVNALADDRRMDFVVGVGDIAHRGTLLQYQNVTPILQQLTLPFYPIMGNEEHGSTVERFLEFANRWNGDRAQITSPRYVMEYDPVALVFASPDHGRDFDDSGIAWMHQQIIDLHPKPVLLIVHGAQVGVYPEKADKGITHPGFATIVGEANLAAVISGDLHMDMDRVTHSKQIGPVHYLHIPALERTKVPDKTRHTPMFRVFSVYAGGEVDVETYHVGVQEPLTRHAYRFTLPQRGQRPADARSRPNKDE